MIKGEPMHFSSTAELDSHLREMETAVTTVEQALELLESTSEAYLAYLDTVTDDQAAEIVQLPFGSLPLGVAIMMPGNHMSSHIAQLDYLQTIWGDHDWRF